MKKPIPLRPRRGDWAEVRFLERAIAHGLTVSKPWGNARYDFLVECGAAAPGCAPRPQQNIFNGTHTAISRVQVKATTSGVNGLYHANIARRRPYLSPGSQPYSAAEIDFFALYVIPADAWYIVPIAAVAKLKTGIRLNPNNPRNKWFPYLEAWRLLHAPAASQISPSGRQKIAQDVSPGVGMY
ncbi:MAG: group I intron-associated PD-(D/E)XK endonuclease, partial [Terriglobales bacterium]